MTAQIHLPFLSFDKDDLTAAYKFIKKIFTKNNRVKFIDSENIIKALLIAVNCIIDDRFTNGDGKGSWGKSESLYRQYMYGEKRIDIYGGGFLTTVLAIQALHKFHSLFSLNNQIKAVNFLKLWKSILNDFDEYIKKRIDVNIGVGFDPASIHEMDYSIEKMKRHTAWLIRLQLIIPRYYKYIEETAEYVVNSVKHIDFSSEKVSTEIAFYSTLVEIKEKNLILQYSENDLKKDLELLDRSIRSKYIKNINGWTAGANEEKGRQPYTLFVLTELIEHENIVSKKLAFILNEALENTFNEPWKRENDKGIALEPRGTQNLGMSLMLISILLKKEKLTKYEKEQLENNVLYVTEELIKGNLLKDQFSWTYSYFVRDLCNYLMKDFNV